MSNIINNTLTLLFFMAACAPAFAGQPRTKILFIGKNPDHPHGTHMYLHTCGVLAKCAELTPGVETVVSNGWPKDAKTLEGVKSIVIYTSPAAELLLEGPHRNDVDQLMKKGVGLVTIHWASSVNQKNFEQLGPTWLSYLGGTWVSNVGLSSGKSPLKQLIPDHPICRGWQEYEIEDEFYLNPTIKQAKPLLQVTERKGKDVIVGWVYERPDGGRAFGTTLGHPYKNFQMEPFRRMIVNGILWSAHVDVPKTGAPVNISEEALALPPQKDANEDPVTKLPPVLKTQRGFSFGPRKLVKALEEGIVPKSVDLIWDPPIGLASNSAMEFRSFSGKGGIVEMGRLNFDAIKEAPEKGYKTYIEAGLIEVGQTYCVKCANGVDYVKIIVTKYDRDMEVFELKWAELKKNAPRK